MILSRFIEHMRQQHWASVFIELVIVILGVFIGLQAQEWSEKQKDRAAEVVDLRALVKDFDSIEASLDAQVAVESRVAHFINETLDLLDAAPSSDRHTHLGMLLGQLSERRTLKIESPTFRELQGSGNLGLIRAPAMRSRIVAYFFLAERWQAGIDKNNEAFVDKGFTTFLRDQGVTPAVWNSKIMGEGPLPLLDSGLDDFDRLMRERYDDRILVGANRILESSPDAGFWDRLRQQLNWRALVATRNEWIALRLKKMTAETRAQTVAYLEERRQ
jgi:hypothetical protein